MLRDRGRSGTKGNNRQPAAEPASGTTEDTALRSLTREERARLSIDAWEPSLLRKLLQAEGRLPPRRKS
jgi:hypothetical protein